MASGEDLSLDAMTKLSAKELAAHVEGTGSLAPEQAAVADLTGDGQVDEADVLALSKAQLKLANKITGAMTGMDELSPEEQAAAERLVDGKINIHDAHRLAADAREANAAAARIKRAKTGQLPPLS